MNIFLKFFLIFVALVIVAYAYRDNPAKDEASQTGTPGTVQQAPQGTTPKEANPQDAQPKEQDKLRPY